MPAIDACPSHSLRSLSGDGKIEKLNRGGTVPSGLGGELLLGVEQYTQDTWAGWARITGVNSVM